MSFFQWWWRVSWRLVTGWNFYEWNARLYTNNFDPITTNYSVISRRNRFASTSLLWTLIVICHCQQFIILNKDNVFTGNLITCMSWPTPFPPFFFTNIFSLATVCFFYVKSCRILKFWKHMFHCGYNVLCKKVYS